ncbi:chemotaxis protein, partial [Candidatus Falkowbacteria bacterium]|nr:chemotaxis protein [Candidatus Falkowbacteria bacterium]
VCEKTTELIGSMDRISESNQDIASLVFAIEEIAEKTKIIDDIVFQTKILSFNASVEAERAGEFGRGFSVVAQEVSNLAKMSGRAST